MRRGSVQDNTAILRTAALAILVLGALLGGQFAVGSASAAGRQPRASVHPPRTRLLGRLTLAEPGTAAQVNTPASPGAFPFQTARSADGRIVVHYYHQPASFAQKLITLAQHDIAQTIQTTLGFPLRQPVNIYVYGSRADFLAGAPITNPAETAALTVSATSTIYLQSSDPGDDGATDALPHELTHVILHQNEDVGHLADYEFGFLPLWLDEGLAAYDEPASAQGVHDYESALDNAMASRHLVDILRDFNLNYPTDPDTDDLAYAESRAFMGYLIQVYGLPTFHHFLDAVRGGQFTLGAQTYFGADLPMLESRWETTLGLPPTVKDSGFAPALSTPFPFPPGTMFPRASQTVPIGITGPVDLLPAWEGLALIFAFLILLALVGRLRSTRPRGSRGIVVNVPEARWQQGTGSLEPSAVAPAPDSGGALEANSLQSMPDDRPYPMPLETLHALAEERSLAETQAAAPLEPASLAKLVPRARIGRLEAVFLLLALPLAAAVGFVAVQLDPLREWHTGYVAAALAAGACGAALVVRLVVFRRSRRVPFVYIVSLLLTALVVVFAFAQAAPAARAQAHAYESADAYALALRAYADSGEPARQLATDEARVHDDWARAALVLEDFPVAATQYDAAILAEQPYGSASRDRAALLAAVGRWTEGLRAAGSFDRALSAYAGQLASPACDNACASQMRAGIATTYLAWAGRLSAAGDYAGALAKLRAVTVHNAGTDGYTQARTAAGEVAALQAFETALQAGARGDTGSMNAQLTALMSTYPHTAAAQMVREAAEPVSGTLADSNGASTTGDRLYFLAFTSQGQAQGFRFDFNTDSSAFKVATDVGAGGAFTVRLPAGYWYVPCWDDPTWASNNYFNASMSPGNSAFLVSPLTPANIGLVVGY